MKEDTSYKLKPNTLYKITFPPVYKDYEDYYKNIFGIKNIEHDHLLCLGEITNMPGHYIMVGPNRIIQWGFHSDIFVEPSDDET